MFDGWGFLLHVGGFLYGSYFPNGSTEDTQATCEHELEMHIVIVARGGGINMFDCKTLKTFYQTITLPEHPTCDNLCA